MNHNWDELPFIGYDKLVARFPTHHNDVIILSCRRHVLIGYQGGNGRKQGPYKGGVQFSVG